MVPSQIQFALLLASCSLIRILKSPSGSQGLETMRARSSLFTAINLAKQMSVDSADLPSKIVIILNAIWNSTKAFRKADGSEFIALRIRGRLVVSPVIDTIWWWRDEYDPPSKMRSVVEPSKGSVYCQSRSYAATDSGTVGMGMGMDPSHDPTSAALSQDAFLLDEQFLADFEWALGDDALFSLDPLPNSWPQAAANTML